MCTSWIFESNILATSDFFFKISSSAITYWLIAILWRIYWAYNFTRISKTRFLKDTEKIKKDLQGRNMIIPWLLWKLRQGVDSGKMLVWKLCYMVAFYRNFAKQQEIITKMLAFFEISVLHLLGMGWMCCVTAKKAKKTLDNVKLLRRLQVKSCHLWSQWSQDFAS